MVVPVLMTSCQVSEKREERTADEPSDARRAHASAKAVVLPVQLGDAQREAFEQTAKPVRCLCGM